MNWVQCAFQSIKRNPLVWLLAAVGFLVLGPVAIHLVQGVFTVLLWVFRVLAFCVVLSIPLLVGYMLFNGCWKSGKRAGTSGRSVATGRRPLARLKRRIAALETISMKIRRNAAEILTGNHCFREGGISLETQSTGWEEASCEDCSKDS